MSSNSPLQEASIVAQCKTLHLPTIGGHFTRLADQALREGHYLVRPGGYIGFSGTSSEALRKYAQEVGLL
jgi:hypothetical protein